MGAGSVSLSHKVLCSHTNKHPIIERKLMSLETKPRVPAKNAWARWGLLALGAVVALFILVLAAKWSRTMPEVQDFLAAYPGQSRTP